MSVSLADIESVYRNRGNDFFRLAVARIGEPEAARDAVQEGFANAIRGRVSYQGTGSLEAWIARCVINAAHDSFRRRQPTDEEANVESCPADRADEMAGNADRVVRAAVTRLPQRQRDALFLRFYLDFSYGAIAEALGVETGTVSAMLHAARASLAVSLQEVAS